VERLNVQKYNELSKLNEETNIKDSGSSQCVISRPGLGDHNSAHYTLEDF
jgi:serum/glucocorticoid-regulated kinase 2